MTRDLETSEAEQLRQRLETELPPALDEFVAIARATVRQLADDDGWSEEQGAWLADKALPPMLTDLAGGADPYEALADGYRKARQDYATDRFEQALAQGQSRDVAFLTLVEIEGLLADRRGEPRTAYSEALLRAGCEAVTASAREGHSSADQITTGFAMMQSLRDEFGDAEQ